MATYPEVHKPSEPHWRDPKSDPPPQNALVRILLPNAVQVTCKFQGGVFVSSRSKGLQWTADAVQKWHLIKHSTGHAAEDKS
jgi:hypothetical protein